MAFVVVLPTVLAISLPCVSIIERCLVLASFLWLGNLSLATVSEESCSSARKPHWDEIEATQNLKRRRGLGIY